MCFLGSDLFSLSICLAMRPSYFFPMNSLQGDARRYWYLFALLVLDKLAQKCGVEDANANRADGSVLIALGISEIEGKLGIWPGI